MSIRLQMAAAAKGSEQVRVEEITNCMMMFPVEGFLTGVFERCISARVSNNIVRP